jgi:3-oxoacyl-(acyl-carrier-protein) synthase III
MSIGGYRPARVVTNAEICEHIDSTPEWIQSRSGIVTRAFAAAGETVPDMAVAAGGKALAQSGVSGEQLGCVLVATTTYTVQMPSAAAEVAHRLGSTAGAFDLNAACAGFTHALAVGADLVRAGTAEYVLVIGSDKFSAIVDRTDRATAFIFGDGAGAAVIGRSDVPGIGPVVWGSDGSQTEAIRMNGDWIDKALAGESAYMAMNGQQVFRWAVYEMAPVARRAAEVAGVTLDDLSAFIPHQANLRITDAMVRALRLPAHVAVARDIVDTGNTSAASVPLAMERMIERGEIKSGDLALTIAFGAGLSYAAQVVTVP